MSETLEDIVRQTSNKEKNIIEWFECFVDSKYEIPFTEIINSSTYAEYMELEKIHKTWTDIHSKISDEEEQVYPDKYLIYRLLDKTQEWRSKFQNIYSLADHIQKLKHKIWDQFCKKFSEDFENHGISIRDFPDFIFNYSKCKYIIFKKILVAKIVYLSKSKEEIIVNKRNEYHDITIDLKKLGIYVNPLPYANWPRDFFY